ncbi:24000_t:CDS:2, partial [Gigaspora margarita]
FRDVSYSSLNMNSGNIKGFSIYYCLRANMAEKVVTRVILLLDGPKVHSYSDLNLYNTTVYTLFPYTTSQLVTNNNEFVTTNNDKLIEELYTDIEALYFQNKNDMNKVLNNQEIVDLVTSVESKINNSDYKENNDSIEYSSESIKCYKIA